MAALPGIGPAWNPTVTHQALKLIIVYMELLDISACARVSRFVCESVTLDASRSGTRFSSKLIKHNKKKLVESRDKLQSFKRKPIESRYLEPLFTEAEEQLH